MIEAMKELPNGGKGQVTFTKPDGLPRLTAVLVNSHMKHGAYSTALQDYRWRRDAQRFYAHTSTDFVSLRVTGHFTTARRVTVRFSEPVLRVSHNSFKIAGARGTLHTEGVGLRLAFLGSGGRWASKARW
jgi:hypothetical protein